MTKKDILLSIVYILPLIVVISMLLKEGNFQGAIFLLLLFTIIMFFIEFVHRSAKFFIRKLEGE